MITPLFHTPAPRDLLISAGCFALGIGLDLAACGIMRRPLRTRALLPFAAFLLFIDCTSNIPLHWAALFLYLFCDKFPWDRWRKKIGSKLSSMTAVAKAAFQRQQTEAFS